MKYFPINFSHSISRTVQTGLIICALFSCEKYSTNPQPTQNVDFVSIEKAVLVADSPEKVLSLDDYYSKNKVAKNARLAARQIAISFSLATNGTPYAHVFNYADEEGFIVVSMVLPNCWTVSGSI